jgi:Flp pilus assembly pilin Flp
MLPDRHARPHAGQSITEVALLIAVIGIVCIPSLSLLREALAAAYTNHQQALTTVSATATPIP